MKTNKKEPVLILYLLTCAIVMSYAMHLSSIPSVIDIVTGNVHHQKINECLCSRKFLYPPSQTQSRTGHIRARLNSSCSDQGTHYQAGQNVITFTLFAKAGGQREKAYLEGVMQNLKMMQKYYPGYSLRLYTNQKLEIGNPYCSLVCNNSNLFWCNIKSTRSHGDLSGMVFRTWRFMTLGDPTVDVFVSRDLDSLISAREAAVVQDWLSKGDKAISVMRDIGYGHSKPVLAGMWQASNNILGMATASSIREKIISLSKMKNYRGKYSDQKILSEVVFFPRAKDIVAYDAYYCTYYRNFTEVRPFPTQREVPSRDFVGNIVNFISGRRFWRAGVCPMECRPDYGKNWTYC